MSKRFVSWTFFVSCLSSPLTPSPLTPSPRPFSPRPCSPRPSLYAHSPRHLPAPISPHLSSPRANRLTVSFREN